MADANFEPGDRVVDLAASLRVAAAVSGSLSCAVALWVLGQSMLWSLAAVPAGAVAGFLIGFVLGRLIYPAATGHVVVVKVGPGARGPILRGDLIGAIAAGAVAATVPALILGQVSQLLILVGIGCGIGAAIGGAVGYLASQ